MVFGIIIHDEYGNHFFSRTHVMPGIYRPEEGEAIGLYEALSWIKDLGLSRVIVEMNAKMVVDGVNGSARMNSVFSEIVDGCRSILVTNPGFRICWVPRDANVMAHCLARGARDFSSPYYWVERPLFVDNSPDIPCLC
ncbi:hypothetical protein ACS0TY_023381 [Phlomoides rotata]